ncbi:alpha/beta hydrolase [Phenylobacterium sp. LjRoot225]|uniref:alpha/beta fold hydrolase n=1 Tax=Phenylobacterium sp. LjRoot225 TaxID=3342285 RepID=UPI003ECD977D
MAAPASPSPRALVLLLAAAIAAASVSTAASAEAQRPARDVTRIEDQTSIRYRWVGVDGVRLFYREAGDPKRPTILLLHGFSSSSHMFRDLMPLLSDRFHLVAPDYPGFGYSDAPRSDVFAPTFSELTSMMEKFVAAVGVKSYVLYVQDFGGPVGFRMAVARPDRVRGLIVQNANAYVEGFPPQPAGRSEDAGLVSPSFIRFMYQTGARDVAGLNPDAWTVDEAALQRPEARRIQTALLADYRTNIRLYPQWQDYLRRFQPRTLVVWGKNDQGFTPAGAEAFRRDVKDVEIRYFNTGHFALEEDAHGIASAIRSWSAGR